MSRSTARSPLEFAAAYREEIDAALHTALAQTQAPPRLAEAMRYSLLAPGKRLRPMLVLLAAETCGCDRRRALPAACAVEMVHAYSLIHDDLPAMDDDDLRRGRPTCHKQFDEATAILAGDALLTHAFQTLAAAPWPADVRVQCVMELSQAAGAAGMVGGQMDDLLAEAVGCVKSAPTHQGVGNLPALESIHARKTGAMFRVSLRLGAIVAQAGDDEFAALDAYGAKLGLAFQIIDDLLDHAGDEAALGKRTNKDADRGKLTFPGLLGADAAAARARGLIDEACEQVSSFAEKGERLAALAQFVAHRNR